MSRQEPRAAVHVAIQNVLENLLQKFSDDERRISCGAAHQPVYDSYYGAGRSVYEIGGVNPGECFKELLLESGKYDLHASTAHVPRMSNLG
jgi:hypothetical protein